ncbi:MAG: sensor histidine kinase [Lachnospiraceae bacterium]
MIKWAISQTKLSEKEQEIEQTQQGQEDFQELLMNIRLRQHEFKNHLLVILSTQYTYKTYEKLVRAQKEYLGRVKDDNKYYSLLLISNQQLAGFLYGKLQSIEEYGIAVECAVKTELNALSIPEYNMIEILGIFMDNAIEALERLEENRKFFLGIREMGEHYYFELRNVFPYIAYEERIRWFEKGVSHKGEGHGLGLYHARQLCEKWGCDIQCDNLEIEEENWIQFNIRIKKVGNL